MTFIFCHFCHFIEEIQTMSKNKYLLKFRIYCKLFGFFIFFDFRIENIANKSSDIEYVHI